jgi:hypothetical protein
VGYPGGEQGYPTTQRTHIWFADVMEEIVERNVMPVNTYYVTYSDLEGALAAAKTDLKTKEEAFATILGTTGYKDLLETYLELLKISKLDPENLTKAQTASVAKDAMDKSYKKLDNVKQVQQELDAIIKEYNDYLILDDAMNKVAEAADTDIANVVIRNSWLGIIIDGTSDPIRTRPLKQSELATLLSDAGGSYSDAIIADVFDTKISDVSSNGNDSYTGMEAYNSDTRNLTFEISAQYGDLVTQEADLLSFAEVRVDGGAIILSMYHGAKVNIQFTVNVPVRNYEGTPILGNDGKTVTSGSETRKPGVTNEDNVFNGALIWIGAEGNSVVATNGTSEALKDITSVDFETEDLGGATSTTYSEKVGGDILHYEYLNVEEAIGSITTP